MRHRLLFLDPPPAEDEYELEVPCTEKGNLCDPLQVQLGEDAVGKLLDMARREPSAPRGVVESAARGVAATTAAALHEGALFNILTTRALAAVSELPSAPPLVGVRKYNDALEKKAQVNDNTTSHQRNNTTTRQHTNAPTQQHTNTTSQHHNNTPAHQHTNTTAQHHNNTPAQHHNNTITQQHDDTTTQQHNNTTTHQQTNTPAQQNANTTTQERNNTIVPQHSNTGRGAHRARARAVGRPR